MLKIQTKTQNIVKIVQNFNIKLFENSTKFVNKIEEKSKGRFYEKWINYWKTVCTDYREVVIDVKKYIKEKPIKAFTIFTTFGALYYCAKHNPDETDFRDTYVRSANRVLLVHPSCQRRESADHLKHIDIYYNHHLIRRLNFGIASVIWIDNFSDQCNTFESQCSYLKVQYSKFVDRIVDVGFLDKWWILSRKMIDYDINY